MSDLKHIIDLFQPISLEEMDSVKLMDRTDKKFILTKNQLLKVLKEITPYYKILEVNGIRMSQYETLYFDTPELKLYHSHQNKKLNRFKIRNRKYKDSNLSFFEIKLKNNKGRTLKDRIKIKDTENPFSQKEQEFLFEKAGIIHSDIQPQIWVNYKRTTLVSQTSCERVTIDSDLHFIKDDNIKRYDDIVIIEVKQERTAPSHVLDILKTNSIREGSLSKYCLGIISLFPGIKQNSFKKNTLKINKLIYASNNI